MTHKQRILISLKNYGLHRPLQKGYAVRQEYDNLAIFDNLAAQANAQAEGFSLEAMIRAAAQRMIQAAVEDEVTEFLQRLPHHKVKRAPAFTGYRNGYHRERTVSTAVGGLRVRVPRVAEAPQKYQSQLVQPYKRRSQGLDELFPKLFVEGLATRDFEPALRCLVGSEAPLSPSTISRLNAQFKDDYRKWKARDLSRLRIVYVWVDGVYLKAGIADEKLCALVVIGVDVTGQKHLLGLAEGYRESAESWAEVLRDLRSRGLKEPALAVADGALGFWAALAEVWPQTKKQQCWLHKTRNILDKLPDKERTEAAQRLRAMHLATDVVAARWLAEKLIREWRVVGYERAAECLAQALERLLTFYEFPVEHAKHIKTTNVVESPFATVRLRTNSAKRFRTSRSGLHLLFKVLEKCEQRWQRLSSPEKFKEVTLPG
jgi:putative transposase